MATRTAPPGSADTKVLLREAKAERREIEKDAKERLRLIDRRIAQLSKQTTASPRKRPTLTAAGQAGKRNVRAAREAIQRLGTATQHQIGEESGVRTGSLTWACRALVEAGEIKPTGKRVAGSQEFTLTAKGKSIASRVRRPGS